MRLRPAWVLLALALLSPACRAARRGPERVAIQLPSDIRSLDPNESVEQVTDAVLVNVFEPLVGFDENLKAEPVLAESWEQASGERWRFRLRRGVRFHDGTPLTAEMARDALLAVQRNPQLEASQFLSSVREIAAPDESTLDIVTVEPRAILASLPFVYVAKPSAPGSFPPLQGTGPYRIEHWKPGGSVELSRWDGYRGPLPPVREAVFNPAPEGDSLAALEAGTADIVYNVAADRADKPVAGGRIVRRPGLTVFYLGLDMVPHPDNPLRDPRVRRALHLALDREELVRKVYKGMATVASQPVAPLVFGFNARIPAPRRDTAVAARLLAEAGYARGFSTRLVISSARLDLAFLIRSQWHEVGVELGINSVPSSDVDRVAAARQVPMYLLGWDCSTGEASEAFEFLLHTPSDRYGRGNYGGYSNAALDSIAEVNAAILDPLKRRRLLEEAATLVMDELPILPLFVSEEIYGVREGIRFRPRADNQVRLTAVSFE